LGLTDDLDVRRSFSRDASGLELIPDCVARASDSQEIGEIVRDAAASGRRITPAGSQTSMTGSSITDDGILLSVRGMNRIADIDPVARTARVEPGLTIGDLNRALAETSLHFAPDPTSENDATVGGAIACNASGARSLRYGATRRHIRAITVVGARGIAEEFRRPSLEKNTVGFPIVHDPVDWFVGSEGTLGIITQAELSLEPRPAELFGLAIPFPDRRAALEFVVAARDARGRRPQCLEYFDRGALTISGEHSGRRWSDDTGAMIYLEDDAGGSVSGELFDAWLALAEHYKSISSDIRVYEGSQALRDARTMRHAVPATMNERGAAHRGAGGRKVSTDWAVPYRMLGAALDASDLAVARNGAPEPVTYGHAGNGHPHQNFIAEDAATLLRVQAAVAETVRGVLAMGGTISAEHGLGKLKREWLGIQLTGTQLGVMRAMKHALDPNGMFAPGNLF
jgi:FAD/FMN-containing dehydrogenase